ncbi:hypothetical protein AVO45_10845 [Ruegeria marisrubri]|uniref:Uncharacterized protein n=1 Tax=Ruegeria marisrubri TaxID=1685379 RepID=A0A0X3TMN2_9RHOB|nr:hypothetical protein [Ruegeria marisrubri]KUJ76974.1 hypothetical protein AVO45_10845 [Ruegeria marisrubri]
MKKILLPAIAFVALSACEDIWDREGVGFTGLDGEPRTTALQAGAAAYVAKDVNIPAELAGVPTIRVSTDQTEPDKMAGVAVDNGGRTPGSAVEVTAEDRNLMLSTVQVNDTLYAVLRAPEGDSSKIDSSVGPKFGSRVQRLTGCLPAGDVYKKGSSSRASGFAVPLDCS